MTVDRRAFLADLCREHLEEASFLYSQRQQVIASEQGRWRAIGGWDERLEAHVDALVVAGDCALELSRIRALDGEPGELFAALCVMCRQRRADLVSEALSRLDLLDPLRCSAAADALRFELPPEWTGFVLDALAREDGRLMRVLAPACGSFRIEKSMSPLIAALQNALPDAPPHELLPLIRAIGSMAVQQAIPTLIQVHRNPDADVQASALLALLRAGVADPSVLASFRHSGQSLPCLALALAGGASATAALTKVVEDGKADSACLRALGVLGDPASLWTLCYALADADLAPAAAQALNWITGARLVETATVPEAVEEAALFDAELIAWRERGEAPRRADGTPYGESVERLSIDRPRWVDWLKGAKCLFHEQARYRSGRLYSPRVLYENLIDPNSDRHLRRIAAQELAIRYRCATAWEEDKLAPVQIVELRDIRAWLDKQGESFEPGKWYFAGARML